MTEAEVERVAVLIHTAFCAWALANNYPRNTKQMVTWEELYEEAKAAHRACARAVLADLCPEPCTATEG